LEIAEQFSLRWIKAALGTFDALGCLFRRPNTAFAENSLDVKRVDRNEQDYGERSRQQYADGAQREAKNQRREQGENRRQLGCLSPRTRRTNKEVVDLVHSAFFRDTMISISSMLVWKHA